MVTVLAICWLLLQLGADLASLCSFSFSSSSSSSSFSSSFLRNLSSSSLVLFFPLYKSLCSRSEIIRSPSNLCFSSCSFIFSRSDHNFIPVYWPKFTGKVETKETVLTSKTGHGSQNRMVQPRFTWVLAFFP